MFITNLPQIEVVNGNHPDADILIQIADPDVKAFVNPAKHFREIHQFQFWDAENDTPVPGDEKFSVRQAEIIVGVLQSALEREKNVVVHCHAGRCRSGAVVEVAEMMGFKPLHNNRQPNVRVKTMLMRELGWYY
jgi:rhodanese-related sulfurtransferase